MSLAACYRTRMSSGVSAHDALWTALGVRCGNAPHPGWKGPLGLPRATWTEQLKGTLMALTCGRRHGVDRDRVNWLRAFAFQARVVCDVLTVGVRMGRRFRHNPTQRYRSHIKLWTHVSRANKFTSAFATSA